MRVFLIPQLIHQKHKDPYWKFVVDNLLFLNFTVLCHLIGLQSSESISKVQLYLPNSSLLVSCGTIYLNVARNSRLVKIMYVKSRKRKYRFAFFFDEFYSILRKLSFLLANFQIILQSRTLITYKIFWYFHVWNILWKFETN